MDILITASAGNLGSLLVRSLLSTAHHLRLMVHKKPLPDDISSHPGIEVVHADLGKPTTLRNVCYNIDCIVHFAGVLFAPHPENFLPYTNIKYFMNLVDTALESGVQKIILISFPHVEGETSPQRPATGQLNGHPRSVHARTRLLAEKYMFDACAGTSTIAVSLRPGMIYGRGVKMIEAGRWLLHHRLLPVWNKPTYIHLISLPDFNRAVITAIEGENVVGIYNLGDDMPLTLQEFIERVARHWNYPPPWRAPCIAFYLAGWAVEFIAEILELPAPITRDFIHIGMASYCINTGRMKTELLSELEYPTINEGIELL
ncbi:MAG: NAD-dependent epimerase/dehydratase family protein [bacterium]